MSASFVDSPIFFKPTQYSSEPTIFFGLVKIMACVVAKLATNLLTYELTSSFSNKRPHLSPVMELQNLSDDGNVVAYDAFGINCVPKKAGEVYAKSSK